MQMQLPKELEELVQELIDDGLYHELEEIIHDALWMLRDRYALYKIKREEVRKMLDIGIQQADRGELIEGELVFAKLKEKIRQRGSQVP
jgi:antitoxin ParD1/3/4